jgi:hypothetical protein
MKALSGGAAVIERGNSLSRRERDVIACRLPVRWVRATSRNS